MNTFVIESVTNARIKKSSLQTRTSWGANIYMRGFENTLGSINPFYYDSVAGVLLYDEYKLQESKKSANPEQLDLLNSTAYLMKNVDATINIVNWDERLPGGQTLKDKKRGGETHTEIARDGKVTANIYVARNSEATMEDFSYEKTSMIGTTAKLVQATRPNSPNEISLAGLHELKHPFLRATEPKLSQADHDKKVEDFENGLRKIYLVGTKTKKGVTTQIYMGGTAEKH